MKNRIHILLLIITAALAACKGSGDIVPYGKPANLNVVNADSNAVNIYQNGARLNNISSIAAGSQTGYMSIASGSKLYELKLAGAVNYSISNLPLTLDTTAYYSLFVAGETSDKIFLANDALPIDSANSAELRFVNASPLAPNLDVYIGTLKFTNVPFKAITTFRFVPGGTTIGVSIYPHNSSNALFNGTTSLTTGSAYTLYTSGIPGNTTTAKFGVTLMVN